MEDLITRLTRFIDIEYDTGNEETDKIWNAEIEDKVAQGEALANLTAEFNSSFASSVNLYTQKNISKFREGSPVVVKGHGINFNGEIEEEDGNRIRIVINTFYGYPNIPDHLIRSSGWLIEKAKVDIRHIIKEPIERLRSQSERFALIQGILSGSIKPEIDDSMQLRAEQVVPAELDTSQREAFIKAFSSKNYYLIQGPPGTGKTHVLAHLAKAFASEGKNVLVTAFTHMGINNALRKIKEVTGYHKTAKIGKRHQAEYLNDDEVQVSYGESLGSNGMDFHSRGVILGATVYAPNTKKLKGFPFDVVIFDEASQMTVSLAVAAMAVGTKYIFIGDHKQLAPIISEKQTDEELSRSIFEYLFQFSPGTMLQTTYRMNKEINIFSSLMFYDGKLSPYPGIANRRLEYSKLPEKHADLLDPELPDIFVEMHHTEMTTYCSSEACLVAELVEEVIKAGIKPKDIAIVTPYRAQVRLIKQQLSQRIADSKLLKKIFLDTVERIQGQEKDLVFYSMVTSDKKKIIEKADFFLQPQRLNVALTRARKKRIVLGSTVLFDLHSEDQEIQQWIEIFQHYLQSTTRISFEIEETSDLF